MTDTDRRSRVRFGLKSLLSAILLVALLLGAFRLGQAVGFDEGERSGYAAGLTAKVFLVTYPVADLVEEGNATSDNFGALMDDIQTTVRPKTWESAGGPATLAMYPQNLSLVVAQTDRGHSELRDYFDRRRSK